MQADFVIDASVAAKFFFAEDGSDRARSLLSSGAIFAAPDLMLVEVAQVAATYVRRGLASDAFARDAIDAVADLVDELASAQSLVATAYAFCRDDGFSPYEASYLALADQLDAPLVTADDRLIRKARGGRWGPGLPALAVTCPPASAA